MATKITTALVAALVVGALMTRTTKHSRAAAAALAAEVMEAVSAAEASTVVVVSTVVDSGSTGDSDAATDSHTASDMDAASDFMAALPTFMARMGMAAVRITSAPTNAIEQHGALVQRRAAAAAHIRTEPHAVVSSSQPDCPNHPPEYTKEY